MSYIWLKLKIILFNFFLMRENEVENGILRLLDCTCCVRVDYFKLVLQNNIFLTFSIENKLNNLLLPFLNLFIFQNSGSNFINSFSNENPIAFVLGCRLVCKTILENKVYILVSKIIKSIKNILCMKNIVNRI